MPNTITSYHHGDLKNELIRGGLEILSTKGDSGLSLRKVARMAGVSEAAPYRHFKDKGALIAAIAEQGFLQLAKRLQEIEDQFSEDARQFYYQTGRAYIDFAINNPDSMRVMFRYRGREEMSSYPDLKDASDEVLAHLVDVVEYCQLEGYTGSGHPLPLALGYWSVLHGLSVLFMDQCIPRQSEQDQDSLISETLNIVFQGWQQQVQRA